MRAFRGCRLRKITIPSTVKVIEERAFVGCEKLLMVFFKGSKPSLGEDVFVNTPYFMRWFYTLLFLVLVLIIVVVRWLFLIVCDY